MKHCAITKINTLLLATTLLFSFNLYAACCTRVSDWTGIFYSLLCNQECCNKAQESGVTLDIINCRSAQQGMQAPLQRHR